MLFSLFGVLYFVVLLRRRKKINSATRYENNYLGDDGSILVILNRPQLECFTIYIGSFLLFFVLKQVNPTTRFG